MKLLIFTQKVDKNDSTLGFFHSWILEFSKKTESVKVICLYKGAFDFPSNVEVFSLGKERGVGKFSYVFNLLGHIQRLNGTYDRVFVHMNPVYLNLLGIYFKIKRIPAYMWYLHKHVDLKLRIATFFVNKVFTSVRESFNLESPKVVYLGHGIDTKKLISTTHTYNDGVLRLVHVGRITSIKNIEILLEAVSILKQKNLSVEVKLFGECATTNDREYRANLEETIDRLGLKNDVNFMGGVTYDDLPKVLLESNISVNMAPKGGMDKAVLESVLLGIPTFASNTAFHNFFGEYRDIFMYEFGSSNELASKIYSFINLENNEEILRNLESKARKDFSLENLVERIVSIMK